MYPNISLQNEEDDGEEDVKVIQRKVSILQTHFSFLKIKALLYQNGIKETKASAQVKTPLGRNVGSRASSSNGISGVLSELKSGFMSIMTPISNGQGLTITNRNE